MPTQEETVVVTVDRTGKIFINRDEAPEGQLKARLSNLFATRVKKEVFLKADAGVPYGDVVKAMAEIKGAGIERLGMVTEPAQRRAN